MVAAERPLSSPQHCRFYCSTLLVSPKKALLIEWAVVAFSLFFPTVGVWNLLLKQIWLEILAGAWLFIKNAALAPGCSALQRGLLKVGRRGF